MTRPDGPRNRTAVAVGIALLYGLGGCLEPFDEGPVRDVSPFGPDGISEDEAPRVEARSGFTTRATRLAGFTAGQPTAFVRFDGAVTEFVPPVWRLYRGEEPLGRFIVNALPGFRGYGPVWRLHRVPVTDRYADERVWSRDAIQAGIELGILETPIETETLIVAPLTRAPDRVEIVGWAPNQGPTAVDVWFSNQQVAWIPTSSAGRLPLGRVLLEARGAYDLGRLNQGFLLDEDREAFDLDADEQLLSTNRLLERGTQSPLCRVRTLRTSAMYDSIDSASGPELVDFEDPRIEARSFPVVEVSEGFTFELCPEVP